MGRRQALPREETCMTTSKSGLGNQGAAAGAAGLPFAGLEAGLGAGLGFFQDWMKAAGSALPQFSGLSGAAAAPGMASWTLPTLDPAELDKRIQDLKTVQFWLEQNARMIAMTIQGLEVQRMTLSTLQGMNVSMDAVRESLKARVAQTPAAPPEPEPEPEPPKRFRPEPDPAAEATPTAASGDTDMINPMRWWDTLTQQFTHLASQAAQSVGDTMGESMDRFKQAQAELAAKAATSTKTSPGKTSTGTASGTAAPRKTRRSGTTAAKRRAKPAQA
jgi:hypothetical protein